jgi:hypothetical protein
MFSRATDWFYEQYLFDSWLGLEIYRGSIMSGPVLGPTEPPTQCGAGGSLPRRKAFYSSLSSGKVKNEWKLYLHSSRCLHDVCRNPCTTTSNHLLEFDIFCLVETF